MHFHIKRHWAAVGIIITHAAIHGIPPASMAFRANENAAYADRTPFRRTMLSMGAIQYTRLPILLRSVMPSCARVTFCVHLSNDLNQSHANDAMATTVHTMAHVTCRGHKMRHVTVNAMRATNSATTTMMNARRTCVCQARPGFVPTCRRSRTNATKSDAIMPSATNDSQVDIHPADTADRHVNGTQKITKPPTTMLSTSPIFLKDL